MTNQRKITIAITTHKEVGELELCLEALALNPDVANQRLLVWLMADHGSELGAKHMWLCQKYLGSVKYHEHHDYLGPDEHRKYVCDQFLRDMDYDWLILIEDSNIVTPRAIHTLRVLTGLFDDNPVISAVELHNNGYNIQAVSGKFWRQYGGAINTERGFRHGLSELAVESGCIGARYNEATLTQGVLAKCQT